MLCIERKIMETQATAELREDGGDILILQPELLATHVFCAREHYKA